MYVRKCVGGEVLTFEIKLVEVFQRLVDKVETSESLKEKNARVRVGRFRMNYPSLLLKKNNWMRSRFIRPFYRWRISTFPTVSAKCPMFSGATIHLIISPVSKIPAHNLFTLTIVQRNLSENAWLINWAESEVPRSLTHSTAHYRLLRSMGSNKHYTPSTTQQQVQSAPQLQYTPVLGLSLLMWRDNTLSFQRTHSDGLLNEQRSTSIGLKS